MFLVCFLSALPLCGQDDERATPLNEDWVKDDLDTVPRFLRLLPVEAQDIKSLMKPLKSRGWLVEDVRLGFGAHRIKLQVGAGYTSFSIDLWVFKNRVAYYEVSANGDFFKWNLYKDRLFAEWKSHGGPVFTERKQGFSFEARHENVFKEFRKEVAERLGPLRAVEVPEKFAKAYDGLISPMNYSEFAYQDPSPECDQANSYIELFRREGREDLVENVLRGYNPGARIIAAIALIRSQETKLLAPTVRKAIQVLNRQKLDFTQCSGDRAFKTLKFDLLRSFPLGRNGPLANK